MLWKRRTQSIFFISYKGKLWKLYVRLTMNATAHTDRTGQKSTLWRFSNDQKLKSGNWFLKDKSNQVTLSTFRTCITEISVFGFFYSSVLSHCFHNQNKRELYLICFSYMYMLVRHKVIGNQRLPRIVLFFCLQEALRIPNWKDKKSLKCYKTGTECPNHNTWPNVCKYWRFKSVFINRCLFNNHWYSYS